VRLPRDVSGAEVISALYRDWGYQKVSQVGSHAVLETEEPAHHRIATPAHKSLRVGTLSNILRAVASHKGVRREEILGSL
jgi:predicted RNA binding protein YcfA (HicA-like mRNA interferase family)